MDRQRGSTMVEVIVSVLLLTIFSAAAMVAVTSSTSASTDNRARVTAAGLAVRELDYVGQELNTSADAASEIIALGKVANPHQDTSLTGGSAEYPFSIDGEDYRVVRQAWPVETNGATACDNPTSTAAKFQGTLVTVTVTWASQDGTSRPHVSSKAFAPKPGAGSGLADGAAQLVVSVSGTPGLDGKTVREGVKIEVAGPGGTEYRVTNQHGCVVVPVTPASTGSTYVVTMDGGGVLVGPGGNTKPTETVTGVLPDTSTPVPFKQVDRAAGLTVTVNNWNESVLVAYALISGGGLGEQASQNVDSATHTATFTGLYPGTYSVWAGNAPPVSVTLTQGEMKTGVEVTVP
jgi:type II secretory pathway pseudopilin PulG